MENECIAEISNVTEFYNVLGNDAEETGRLFIKNVLTTIFHHIDRNINFYRTILKLDRTSRLEEKNEFIIQRKHAKLYKCRPCYRWHTRNVFL